jgi:hypothetical protein
LRNGAERLGWEGGLDIATATVAAAFPDVRGRVPPDPSLGVVGYMMKKRDICQIFLLHELRPPTALFETGILLTA